jgi:uncharacterized membrane protein
MIRKQISYTAAFEFAFSAFINNMYTYFILWLMTLAIAFIGMFGTYGLIFISAGYLVKISYNWNAILPLFSGFYLVGLLFINYYQYQLLRFAFEIYEGKQIVWKDFFVFSKLFFFYGIARIIRWTLIFFGCFLVVPALYWATKYYFAGYSFVEDRSLSISEDRTFTKNLTQGVRWKLIGFAIINWFFMIIASITLQFALPIIYLAKVHIYQQLRTAEKQEMLS